MSKNLYHEIKNHLSVCDLYTEIIRKTLEKNGIQDETLTRAIRTIKNSLTMISESTVELRAQVEDIKLSQLNLNALVSDVFITAVAYTNGKDIDFINEIPFNYEFTADKNKMFSVFINLVKNGIEAINIKGYIKFFVLDNCIYVENNGEIIPENISQKIFNDGFTTKNSGSGIGLVMVKQMLDMQNYDIKLYCSNKDKTVFKIEKKNPQ